MRTNRVGAAALIAVLAGSMAAGCGGSDVIAQNETAPTGEWLSTSVTEDGKKRKLVPGTRVGLTFTEDGRLHAHAGCNSMGGTVTFSNGHLQVEELSMTEMGCPGDGRHEQDQWLAAFLAEDPAYTSASDRLDLETAGARIELATRELVEPDLPLEGIDWTITHLTFSPPPGGAPDADSAVSSAANPSAGGGNGGLVFDAGKVRGNAGCVKFSGPATVGESTVEIGALDVDRSACSAQDDGAHVLKVLSGTIPFRTTPNTLTLTHASGRGLQLSGPG